MNIEWYIDDEFTAEQRTGSLEVSARVEFPIHDDHLASLQDDDLLREAENSADRLHPGFKEFFEEIVEHDGDAVIVRGTITVYVPVTDNEDVIIEHALDSVNDDIDGGSEAVVELTVHDVVR